MWGIQLVSQPWPKLYTPVFCQCLSKLNVMETLIDICKLIQQFSTLPIIQSHVSFLPQEPQRLDFYGILFVVTYYMGLFYGGNWLRNHLWCPNDPCG